MKRILFIGLGGVGQRHLRNLLQFMPEVEIGAVRHANRAFEIRNDLSVDEGVDIVKKYRIQCFDSIESALETNFSAAVVSNPSSLHFETAKVLLKHGVPVLLEKPIAINPDEHEALLQISKKYATPLMVVYQFRFHPCVEKLKMWLSEGRLGNLHSIDVSVNSYMPDWHQYENYETLYAANKALGGGVVLTEIHELDLLDNLFGQPESVAALGGKLSNLNLDVEDTVLALMKFKTNHKYLPASVKMSFTQKPVGRRFCIYGEKGYFQLDLASHALYHYNVDNQIQARFVLDDFDRNVLYAHVIQHFVKSLDNMPTDSPIALENVMGGQALAIRLKEAIAAEYIGETVDVF